MLDLQPLGVAETERVEDGMWRLLAAGDELLVIKQLRRKIHNGFVGAVVFTQHDHAGAGRRVQVVQALQERDVETLLAGVV